MVTGAVDKSVDMAQVTLASAAVSLAAHLVLSTVALALANLY